MDRSTDSRRARNSDSVTIGGRRRPVSRPSRRRCFLASSLVEPLTERTSLLAPARSVRLTHVHHGVRRVVRAGSVGAVPGRTPAALAPPPPAAGRASPSASASADPPASASASPPSAGASAAGVSVWASVPSPPAPLLVVLRLRLREDGRRFSPWPPPAASAGTASWPGSLSCDSGAPSVPSAAVSWSPFRPRPRLERRLRRRPVPVPSSSSAALSPFPAAPADPAGPAVSA